jgi:hypothetical protein
MMKRLQAEIGPTAERGQHDALDALVVGITTKKVNFILDADIRSYFDTVNQDWLIRFLKHRINDPRMIRLTRAPAPVCIAFRLRNGVSTRDMNLYEAQWLAYVVPCRRFAAALAGDRARLGVDVDRYSFIVSDLHRLLIAGLPAHCEKLWTLPPRLCRKIALPTAETGVGGDSVRKPSIS